MIKPNDVHSKDHHHSKAAPAGQKEPVPSLLSSQEEFFTGNKETHLESLRRLCSIGIFMGRPSKPFEWGLFLQTCGK